MSIQGAAVRPRGTTWRRAGAVLGVAVVLVSLAPALAAATEPTGPAPRAASDRCLIGMAHSIFLDRPATEAEQTLWSERFDTGTPAYRLPQDLAGSDEWLTVVVTGLYRDALDRGPDPAGLAYWIGELRRGALVNRVASLVYGSPEYYARAGGTADGFVADIYLRILHRTPDPRDHAYWMDQVATRGRGWVAASFFASVESRTDRVNGLYRRLLGRSTDPAGRIYWVGQLTTVNDVTLAVRLASSPEFATRATAVCAQGLAITQGNDSSYRPAISADGRYVTFWSDADDLVPGDTNGSLDIFTWDRTTGVTTRITNGNADSYEPAMSADGRHITFYSFADDLVPGDTNGSADIFTWDRTTGVTTRITNGNRDSYEPAASADGRHITYQSNATDLVPDDTNDRVDIFTWDRTTGVTARITNRLGDSTAPTISADGSRIAFHSPANNILGGVNNHTDIFTWSRTTGVTRRITSGNSASNGARISADGRYTTFHSSADDLVPGDTNGRSDIFVWDLTTSVTTRITDGNGSSFQPTISADGSRIAFYSDAGNLVPGDTNGKNDIFTWDRTTGVIAAITNGSEQSLDPEISEDGRSIAYWSFAGNLVPGDTNGKPDIFLWTYVG